MVGLMCISIVTLLRIVYYFGISENISKGANENVLKSNNFVAEFVISLILFKAVSHFIMMLSINSLCISYVKLSSFIRLFFFFFSFFF